MFERRLKIFLILLLVFSGVLALRAGQLQLLDKDDFAAEAAKRMQHVETAPTVRGRILDRTGNVVLAEDSPCIDAAVEYDVITETPDPVYVQSVANEGLTSALGKFWGRRSDAKNLLDVQETKVRNQIAALWTELSNVSGLTPDEINDIRRQIVARVEMQRRAVGWRDYSRSETAHDSQNWVEKMLDDTGSGAGADLAATRQPYVILHDVKPQAQAVLSHDREKYPALVLIPGSYRNYPLGRVACHVIGYLGQVDADQINNQADFDFDALKRYKLGDNAGKVGIEALCEKTLRGERGMVQHVTGSDDPDTVKAAEPGKDVRISIDAGLQQEIEQIVTRPHNYKDTVRSDQHCAVVVLDVATNDTLALVSNPGFNLNEIGEDLPSLSRDELNTPLLDRATMMVEEPGSTAKIIVGSGAITDNIWSPTDTVVCHGELVLGGKVMPAPHCWIYAAEKERYPDLIPTHNLTGGKQTPLTDDKLTIADGLERSCNVTFETIADKMGMEELLHWFDMFGLGKPTGIGIEESAGALIHPERFSNPVLRTQTWNMGIGQGYVRATPIQMANVAAMIARGGIWMRPHLVDELDMGRASANPIPDLPPARIDRHLSPDAVHTVQEGMYRVVNGSAGTGIEILPQLQNPPMEDDPLSRIHIAGKTGTAQSEQLSVHLRDAEGNFILDENGKPKMVKVALGTPGTAAWYQAYQSPAGDHFDHAWYIGYAPAEHPQVAFCVMVQFGVSGGGVAGPIAHDVLEACYRHRYLSIPNEPNTAESSAR